MFSALDQCHHQYHLIGPHHFFITWMRAAVQVTAVNVPTGSC